jgi:hypothetical protein
MLNTEQRANQHPIAKSNANSDEPGVTLMKKPALPGAGSSNKISQTLQRHVHGKVIARD